MTTNIENSIEYLLKKIERLKGDFKKNRGQIEFLQGQVKILSAGKGE